MREVAVLTPALFATTRPACFGTLRVPTLPQYHCLECEGTAGERGDEFSCGRPGTTGRLRTTCKDEPSGLCDVPDWYTPEWRAEHESNTTTTATTTTTTTPAAGTGGSGGGDDEGTGLTILIVCGVLTVLFNVGHFALAKPDQRDPELYIMTTLGEAGAIPFALPWHPRGAPSAMAAQPVLPRRPGPLLRGASCRSRWLVPLA